MSNNIPNDQLFNHYSDQDLIEAFENIDPERFPDRYKSLISEIKSRNIDVCNPAVYHQKKQTPIAGNHEESFSWVIKCLEDKRNIPRILFKIFASALISTISVIFVRFSYIEGFRGKHQASSSTMTYNEACAYLKETLDRTINMWLILFLLFLAYFVWKKKYR